jgi:hypothetical protein
LDDAGKLQESEKLKKRAAELIKVGYLINNHHFLKFYFRMVIIMLLVKNIRLLLIILNHQIMIMKMIKKSS